MRRSKGRAAARRWAALVCRRARRCAPKCGRVERNAVPAADREPDKRSDTAVTGALPVPSVPRAALVTGGGRRIGRALSLALSEEGYAVAIHHHDSKNEAEALAVEITRAGGKGVALAADLSDESAVAELLRSEERRVGKGCRSRRTAEQLKTAPNRRVGNRRSGAPCPFFFQAEDGIRDRTVTGVQTCALPIYYPRRGMRSRSIITTRRTRPKRLPSKSPAPAARGSPWPPI